jgi:hypothetical protein
MSHRLHAVIALPRLTRLALVGAAFACFVAVAAPAEAAHHQPSVKETSRFLWGLAGEESGWNYFARNSYSGAFGKYQIMPFNWGPWTRQYIGDGWVDWTPANQEVVARAKVLDLYAWLGEWRRVAYWWLTGDTDKHKKHWSPVARHYVRNVLSLMESARGHRMSRPDHPSRHHWVRPGDRRLATTRLVMHRKPGIKHTVGHIHSMSSLKILKLRHGPRHHSVWFKARNKKGVSGWVQVKRTYPLTHGR